MSSYNDYQHWPQESTSNSDEDELSSPEIEQDDSDDDTESSTSSTSTSGTSSSGSSQSGSDSESTSTADEDEAISLKTETVIANKTELSLPAGMCEDEGVFKQLFSVNSWVCLSDVQKQHLKNFLPTFSENDLMEKEITLRMLFGGQSFRFGVNPIDDFHDKLKDGHFRPDIVKMKSLLRRSLKREYRKSQRIYNYNMLKKLLSGRKKVIDDLNGSSTKSITKNGGSNSFTMHQQVKRRYFQEVSDIKQLVGDVSEDSSDSNYQEGPPVRLGKKQRRNLSVLQSSLSPELEIITSTLATFPDRIDLSKVALPTSNPFEPSDEMYKEMLISHKRKKKRIEQENKRMKYEQINEHIKPVVPLGTVEKKKSANSDRSRLKRIKPVKHQNQSIPAPVKLDIQPSLELDVQPPVQFDVQTPVPLDVKRPVQLDVQSPVQLSVQPQVQLDAQPQVQLDAQPQVQLDGQPKMQLDVQSHKQIDAQSQVQLDVQPTNQLDEQPTMELDETQNISLKQEDMTQSETCNTSYIKEEILQNVVSPPLLSPSSPSISLSNTAEEESIKTNLNAIKLDPCTPILTDFLKMEEEITLNNPIKLEPISLTAEEIRKAEEGQAAAAMLLEQMSDVEEKYNPPLIPSPPLPSPPPSPPPSLPLSPPPSSPRLSPPPLPDKILESKFSPPKYIQREFHPEDMLTSTVQTMNTESPPRIIHSCLRSLTSSDYGSKQLSLSPVSTPSKIITDSSYVGSLSELEGFHVLDIKTMCNEDLDLKIPQMKKMVSSFFALIRDIICANWDYRMNMTALNEQVNDWVISTFNNRTNPDWYHSLTSKTWPKSLHSAIGFLAGHFPEWQPEDFVPYIEYKPNLDIYQWIGAGRDSDTRLGDLCKCWLHNLNNISSKLKSINDEVIGIKNVPIPSTTDIISKIEMSETDSTIPVPLPLLDTWVVTPSNDEERAIFQAQEKQRFLKPHRSFIYQMHGYESVVGPVRGIYNSSNIHKAARGHSLLIENRPHFISILVLVRDATARLPNGMGTRSDICTLLKDSQYLMEANLTELHNAVSGALDRLHYEHDPCVKYDPKRKIWIYLHRGRKLEEFERLHLEQQGAVKMKCWRRNKTPKKPPEPKHTPNRKLTSNVLLESLSMLDLPTSSTSDSMPSSSTSPVLSEMRVTQDMTGIDHSKQLIKTPRVTKNRKVPIQTMQMTDNAVELNVESPTLVDQNNSTVSSQLFSMPVSNHISTVTASNSSIISSNNIPNQSFSGNITSHSITSNNSQSIANSFTCHSIANNISSQSIAGNILSQSKAGNNLKVVSSQALSNSGQMINISQTMNSNNQTFINNNKMVVNNISSNKQMISSGDLITIGPRKKTKHVQIAQPVSIGQSSGLTNYQHDHHLSITKPPQIKEQQRQILVLKQKRSDHTISSSEQNTTVVGQTDTIKPQTVQHFIQLQNQQKSQKQQQNMQLKILQHKQIQQQTLQQNKQQVIIRKTDGDDKTETVDTEQPQVIFLKQGPRNVQQQEAQQITQQQLQQLLMLRPQQQTGQQAQVVMVKQQGNDQKSIALKPILTSLRGTKIQQTPSKTTNLLVQANQATQNVQRKMTKPLVGKFVSNQRAQLPVDSVLANRKLSGVPGTPLRISGVQTSKSGQPHYTVVTVAQPKLMPSNQPNIGQKTPTRISNINDRLKPGDTNQPQTVRVVQSQIGGKPLLVTNKAQISSALTGISTSSSVVSSTANTYTVVQQGSQQILVPASSLKSFQGLKVIPISQHNLKGRSQMFARILNSDSVRPVFIHQQSNQDTCSQGPNESNT